MATVIQGQGTQPNAIGRSFGAGLSQAVDRMLKQKQGQEIANQLAPLLQANQAQLPAGAGDILTKLITQSNDPASLAAQLVNTFKPQQTLDQEAQQADLAIKEIQSKIKESIARTALTEKKTEAMGKPNPLEQDYKRSQIELNRARTQQALQAKSEKKVDGVVNGRPVFDTIDNILAQNGRVGKSTELQNRVDAYAKRFSRKRKDLIDAFGEVKPNIASHAALITSNGKNVTYDRLRERHYNDTTIKNDAGDIIANPQTPKDLTKLLNVAERIFRSAYDKMIEDPNLPADAIPDSDSLMALVSNHLSDLENRIRSGKLGQENKAITESEKKMLKLDPKQLEVETQNFLRNLEQGNLREPENTKSGSNKIESAANTAAEPPPQAKFKITPEIEQKLINDSIRNNVTDPSVFFSNLIELGVSEQQASDLADKLTLALEQRKKEEAKASGPTRSMSPGSQGTSSTGPNSFSIGDAIQQLFQSMMR